MNKNVSQKALYIKIIISGCFFWVLFSFVETEELIDLFSHINKLYFSLSVALIPIMLLVSCFKWKLILDLHGKKISFIRLLRIYLIGYLFSNILPSTFGGDVARSYYSGKIIKNQSFSAIAVFIERFSGVLLLMLLVILAPLIRVELYLNPYIYIPCICALTMVSVMIWIWKIHSSVQILHHTAKQIISFSYKVTATLNLKVLTTAINGLEKVYLQLYNRIKRLRDETDMAVSIFKKNKYLVVVILLLTTLFYLLTFINVYVSFLAFGVTPDFWEISSLIPVILFVAQVPVTLLGNIGFFESVFVFYFLLIGIPGVETLAMGLLLRLKMITTGGIGYFIYITYKHPESHGEEIDQLERNI